MTKLTKVGLALALTATTVFGANEAASFGGSLRDCYNLFDQFDATLYYHYSEDPSTYAKALPYAPTPYDGTYNPYYYGYELVSCSFPGVCPDTTDIKSTC